MNLAGVASGGSSAAEINKLRKSLRTYTQALSFDINELESQTVGILNQNSTDLQSLINRVEAVEAGTVDLTPLQDDIAVL